MKLDLKASELLRRLIREMFVTLGDTSALTALLLDDSHLRTALAAYESGYSTMAAAFRDFKRNDFAEATTIIDDATDHMNSAAGLIPRRPQRQYLQRAAEAPRYRPGILPADGCYGFA